MAVLHLVRFFLTFTLFWSCFGPFFTTGAQFGCNSYYSGCGFARRQEAKCKTGSRSNRSGSGRGHWVSAAGMCNDFERGGVGSGLFFIPKSPPEVLEVTTGANHHRSECSWSRSIQNRFLSPTLRLQDGGHWYVLNYINKHKHIYCNSKQLVAQNYCPGPEETQPWMSIRIIFKRKWNNTCKWWKLMTCFFFRDFLWYENKIHVHFIQTQN